MALDAAAGLNCSLQSYLGLLPIPSVLQSRSSISSQADLIYVARKAGHSSISCYPDLLIALPGGPQNYP